MMTTTKNDQVDHENEGPIGKSQSSLDLEDALASSLGRLAYPVPKKVNRRSRFWFTLEDPAPDSKEAMAPRQLQHIDSEIVERLAAYQLVSPKVFQANIEQVREFFLTEVAPKTLAVSGGTTQATEVLKRMLETDIDASTAQRFNNMVNRAATLKMAQFVATYFGLPLDHVDAIIGIGHQTQQQPDLRFILNHVDAVAKSMKADLKQLSNRIEDAQK